MKRMIPVKGKESIEEGLKAFGEEIIEKRNEILKDLDNVISITIKMEIKPGEVMNYEINKNYVLTIEDSSKE